MNRRKILLLSVSAAAAVALGALLVATQRPAPQPSATSGASASPASVAEVATVELREVTDFYAADAVIEAVRAATVSAQIAGNVTRFYVDAGERVKRGDLLVRIDARDTDAQVAAGAARVAQAEAQLAQAKLGHARTVKLVEQKFVSQAAFDKAEADLKSAQADLEVARAGASQASTARSFAEVRSPIDGVVTRRLAELGELASPGKPLLEVHDPAALRAVAAVPQFILPRIAGAREAEIVLPLLGVTLRAKSVTVLPAADARLLSTQVRAELPAALPAGVIPGTAAKVLLPAGTAKRLVVPEAAVLRRGELTAAHVIGADGQLRLRQIRLGEPAGNGLVEVLAGLDAGERVELR
ncbi:MAG TPA: efflux RND transporter periplasmic adaptor subunit [Burkholderiales bacterium]|nr:efflux RND transporter periplasmic adaptor subunit [Burkholderiales bacterium]